MSEASAYYPQLRNFIRKRVSSIEDTEDIVQDVFYQYSRLDTILNPIENVAAWLYRVARNRIIDASRKKREESMIGWDGEVLGDIAQLLMDEDSTPEMQYMSEMVWERLEEALAELPAPQRDVFELTEMQGLSFKEIEALTGVAQATLISRKHYAVLHLRARLADIYDDMG